MPDEEPIETRDLAMHLLRLATFLEAAAHQSRAVTTAGDERANELALEARAMVELASRLHGMKAKLSC